ncbi:anaphase promoting complex subunit doc1 [Ascosphaera atra]|nr:anaphase promoting complex subunit doc1 [Ascosphaera atra]
MPRHIPRRAAHIQHQHQLPRAEDFLAQEAALRQSLSATYGGQETEDGMLEGDQELEYEDSYEREDTGREEEGEGDHEMVEDGDEDERDENDVDMDEMGEEYGEQEDFMNGIENASAPIPPNLREISSLASWSLSTYKPGCGIANLRNPSPAHYWQSDGPQPHTLTLHFFKRVEIVRLRVYLDFDLDESYTPTNIIFSAGMGGNDLVEFATWRGEQPRGWVDINLEGVGGRHRKVRETRHHGRRRSQGKNVLGEVSVGAERRRSSAWSGEADESLLEHEHEHASAYQQPLDDIYVDENENDENEDHPTQDEEDYTDEDHDPNAGNVLKAMVIQMKITENHQNGKDSHVRGLQVFSRDDKRVARAPATEKKSLRASTATAAAAAGGAVGGDEDEENNPDHAALRFSESDYLPEPELR